MSDQKSNPFPPRDGRTAEADDSDNATPNADGGASDDNGAAKKKPGKALTTVSDATLSKSEKKLEKARKDLITEYEALGAMLETLSDPEKTTTAHNVRQKTDKIAKQYAAALDDKSAALKVRANVSRAHGHALMDFLGAGELNVDLTEAIDLMDKGASRKDVLAALSRAVTASPEATAS